MKKLFLNETLGFNLNRVAILFRRELTRCLAVYRLTPEQWQVLAALWSNDSLNQKEIARITLQDAPTVSRMIKRMETNGFIERLTVASDARITLVKPTPSGLKLKTILPPLLETHFRNFLVNFPKNKQKLLKSLLLDLRQ